MRFTSIRFTSLALAAALALPLGLAAQTPASPDPGTPPVTSQTPAATNGTAGVTPPDAATGAHMNKKERKAFHQQQKREEKSAYASAKAAKDNAKALKAQNKATDAAQQAQSH